MFVNIYIGCLKITKYRQFSVQCWIDSLMCIGSTV